MSRSPFVIGDDPMSNLHQTPLGLVIAGTAGSSSTGPTWWVPPQVRPPRIATETTGFVVVRSPGAEAATEAGGDVAVLA